MKYLIPILILLPFIPSSYAYERPPELPLLVAIEAEVTAYNAVEAQTDDRPWEMANGETVHPGVVACPSRYPFGTQFLINDEWYTCKDRMNIRYDCDRDPDCTEGKLYFDILVEGDAWSFGRQRLTIYELKP